MRTSRWLVLIAWVSLGLARSLQASTSAVDTVCIGSSTPPFCSVFFLTQPQDASGTATLNGTFGPTSAQETVTANAHAGYGVLNASASSSYSVSGTPESDFVTANSSFEDLLTISDPILNGQAGSLYVSYSLDGQITGSGFGVVIAQGGTSPGQQVQEYDSSVNSTFALAAPITFVYGQAFDLSMHLSVSAGTPTGYGVLNAVTGSGSGTADFFNTFVLTGLNPTDSNGKVVTGALFSSQSGTTYSVDGVVPEPSTVVPLLLGIVSILAAKRRWATAR